MFLTPFSFITECIRFMVGSTLVLLSMMWFLLKFIIPIGMLILVALTFARRTPIISIWDGLGDIVKPIVEKTAIVIGFIFLFTTIGSFIDPLIGTTVEASGASGVIGAAVGIGFLFII